MCEWTYFISERLHTERQSGELVAASWEEVAGLRSQEAGEGCCQARVLPLCCGDIAAAAGHGGWGACR
ncbi:Alpha-ketoglutaric semialdehyde dehydrogenase 1 [Dissostichus eleginoides]|uniref:Alpha-ketoglutaric semialdehyde dehydrogenase 1 n=1 Tax=Dissostichus eleginoides TaxID=100907 RepID=A0AAD9C489_DISEL|nr:Alpha-ketoglutaric semialdehyde dehydrogenase 1 [Dissostichus eleginoides]